MRGLQVTLGVLRVMCLFSQNQPKTLWSYAVAKRLGITQSQANAMLHRLQRAGWITSTWEVLAESQSHMRRRMYRITPKGTGELRRALVGIALDVGPLKISA